MNNIDAVPELFDLRLTGQAFQKARIERGWTQEHTAERLGISREHLVSIENNRKNPSYSLYINIQRLFNTTFQEFIFSDPGLNEISKSSIWREVFKLLETAPDEELRFIKKVIVAHRDCKDDEAEK